MVRTAIHPGEPLPKQLEEMSMSAAELARNLKVPTNRITVILNGRHSITGDTALRRGHFFETDPEFWLNLQKIYELRLAEDKSGGMINGLPILGFFLQNLLYTTGKTKENKGGDTRMENR